MVSAILCLVACSIGLAQDEAQPKASGDLLDVLWARPGHIVGGYGYGLASLSPDGNTLASGGGADGTVKIWDLKNRKLLKTIVLYPKQKVPSVDFATDGSKLLVCGSAYTAVLDSKEWRTLRTFPASSVRGAIFINRNRSILLLDQTQIIDIERGTQIARLSDAIQNIYRLPYLFPHGTPVVATSLYNKDRSVFVAGIVGPKYLELEVWHKEYLAYVDTITFETLERYKWFTSGKISNKRHFPSIWPGLGDMALLASGELVLYGTTTQGGRNFIDLQTADRTFSQITEYPLIPISNPPKNVGLGVCFSPDRSRFAILLGDRLPNRDEPYVGLRLIEAASMSPIGQEVTVPGVLRGLAIGEDSMVAHAGGLAIYPVDGRKPEPLTFLHSPISSIAYSREQSMAAASTLSGEIHLWRLDNPGLAWNVLAPRIMQRSNLLQPMSAAVLTDLALWEGKLVGAAFGPYVMVLDAKTGKLLHRHLIDPDTGTDDRPLLRYTKGGSQFIAGTPQSQRGVRRFDTESGKELQFYGPSKEVATLDVTANFVFAMTEGMVRGWDLESGKLVYEWKPQRPFTKIVANESLKVVVALDTKGTLASYDMATGQMKNEFKGLSGPILAVCTMKNNRLAALGDDSLNPAPLLVWDLATGKKLAAYTNEIGPCSPQFPLSNNLIYDEGSATLILSRSDATVLGVKID